MAAVTHKHIDFLKRAFVKKLVDTFAGCIFATVVLFLNGFFAAAEAGFIAQGYKLLYFCKLITHI